MIILYKLFDFSEVIRIKVVAIYAEMLRFGKELLFVCVFFGGFVIMTQCWIVALTLWREKVFDFTPRLALVGL